MKPFPDDVDNLLLEAMPEPDRRAMLDVGDSVELRQGEAVFSADGYLPHVFFPHSGMLSVVIRMQDGATVETVTIGKEGVTGPPLVAEHGIVSNVECICQIPATALRVPTDAFLELRRGSETLDELLTRYGQVVFAQIAQTAACNRLHSIEARTSRWLLLAHDRIGGQVVPLTQEFLAEMLGVRRETVSLSARMLQNAGLIEYSRGKVRILDRDGLESTSCECYAAIRSVIERLFPFL